MFSIFYNVALALLAILSLPKLLWQWCVYGKYRSSLLERLGLKLPDRLPDQQVIWIHAVSMGETRAVIPVYQQLKKQYPDAAIVISSTTETGHAEAKRSMPGASLHFFIPFDFSWIMRRIMAQVHPNALIFVESDFWYHLVSYAKKQGARVMLVNGKVSKRSSERFTHLSFFTRRLFANFDHLCVQSSLHQERFVAMGIEPSKITVTGNLKFDAELKRLSPQELTNWKQQLGIASDDRVITLGSTHAHEEQWLLTALEKVWAQIPHLKVLLVPRHPERFEAVAQMVLERKLSLARYSERALATGSERIVLIDAMGLLTTCYQLSEIGLVGGSFTDKIGGHNVYEPVLLDVPVLFGPHMFGQTDLVDLVLQGHAGKQVSLSELPSTILIWLTNETERQRVIESCQKLVARTAGSLGRTLSILREYL